jgi:hypothetical protein
MGTQQQYLLVTSSSKQKQRNAGVLTAYDFVTCTTHNTQRALDQLKVVSAMAIRQHRQEQQQQQFSIPVIRNSAMMTFRLIPALFKTGVKDDNNGAYIYDSVLGSRRIWPEHMALKASILYLFQGQPGPLWDLALQVVQNALPKTWELVTREPPEEIFLRALSHPDVVETGRLLRRCNKNPDDNDGTTTPRPAQLLLPSKLDIMSRIYALGRFVRTLEDSSDSMNVRISKGPAVCQAVASTMKLHQKQVGAIVHEVCQKKTSLSLEACTNIAQIQGDEEGQGHDTSMTPEAMEVLGMLALFLNHDRKSLRDASCITASSYHSSVVQQQQNYTTTKALVDCAMYCGTVRWLSQDDEEEEGIWSCLPCLHRWQKRGHPREAYQTRKLMHPMKMIPFTREEYYDPDDWDKIMEATDGDISKLGAQFYWGKCSTDDCGSVCRAVARTGACAETDGLPLDDFPETVNLNDGENTIQLRRSLAALGPLGPNSFVTADNLEKYFNSDEKLEMYLPGPVRRRVRNCIDKSTYILPRGLLCDRCGVVPDNAVEDYCPYCGTGFEPVFACVHYSCPQCGKHFCKACSGIDGIHFHGVYSSHKHVCWRVLGNRYSYHNKGLCAKCNKERPWPTSHALVSAGPAIRRKARTAEVPIETAIQMQSFNLKAFTDRYKEAVEIFESCAHTVDLGPDYCHCGADVSNSDYCG